VKNDAFTKNYKRYRWI